MDFSGCGDDAKFGPTVQGCRGNFDFTIKFEQIFLSILPACIFIAASLPRVAYLWQQPVIVAGAMLRSAKLICIAAMAGMQLGLLVLTTAPIGHFRQLFAAASALAFVASLAVLALSFFEHGRAPRPSMLLMGYLALSILFDITQTRTLWLAHSGRYAETVYCRLFSAGMAFKAVLILLESVHKTAFMTVHWDRTAHSPEEVSGLLGLGAFAWLNSLFFLGFRKVLDLDDLFALDATMTTERLEAKLAQYREPDGVPGGEKTKGIPDSQEDGQGKGAYNFGHKRFGLAWALAKTLAVPILLPVAPRVANAGFQFCQPFLINATLDYLQSDEPRSHGYGLIGAAAIIYWGTALSAAFYGYYQERLGFILRGTLAGAVYRATTSMPLSAADDSAALTLMSTDVENIRTGLNRLHDIWTNLAQVALACWLLERQLGAAFAAPLVVVACCSAATILQISMTSRRQKAWMERISKRVGMTANAITHMKHIKISGLAAPLEALIHQLRVDELRVGWHFRMMLCVSVMLSFAPVMLSPVFAFALTVRSMGVTRVYTALSYINLLTSPLTSMLQMMPTMVGGFACLERLQAFLEKDARVDFRQPLLGESETEGERESEGKSQSGNGSDSEKRETGQLSPHNTATSYPAAITIRHGHFGWAPGTWVLNDINVVVPVGKLTIVVGPVASGKSTLSKALLGETPAVQGLLRMNLRTADGRRRQVAYCDQVPCLSNASIRDNIIGLDAVASGIVDETRYGEAVDAAMLRPDLELFPDGDQTRIGSNGISLSGGQKQRVSLARALYASTDLLVLDDVLSGLDNDTEEQVFRRVFGPDGLLRARRRATTVLCTHSVRHLPLADHIVALASDGTVLEQGTFASLQANSKYVQSLGIKEMMPSTDLQKGGDLEISEIYEASEASETKARKPSSKKSTDGGHGDDAARSASRQMGDSKVHKYYFSLLGAVPLGVFLFSNVLFGFLDNWGTIWLKFWTEDSARAAGDRHHGDSFYLGMYGFFQGLCLISLLVGAGICLGPMITLSGSRLHRMTLSTVVRAPLRFFTSTDAGLITNYFSQDMSLIDGPLPVAMINAISSIFELLGSAAVIATASPYLCISYPILAGLIYCIQKFYLRTSRQLRLLDLEAKSPLYTHFLDTIKGVATYRAFGWTPAGIAISDRLVDRSQRPMYQLAMIQQWLNFVLRVVVSVLAIVVITLATQLRSSAGFTGASLISLMNLGELISWMIVSYTTLETSIGAVSRLKSLSETVTSESAHDEPMDRTSLPATWPNRGEVVLKGVSATYDDVSDTDLQLSSSHDEKGVKRRSDGIQLVLDDLSLSFCAGEKVAICGRTGSGKSSTILLLLRMLDPLPTGGSITIDGISTDQVDRTWLRERIIAVPQDAVFLPDGTSLQENLDPMGQADASMCEAVFKTVGLWAFVEAHGGLDGGLQADSMSQGQKQLFNLARAILRRRVRAATEAVDGGLLLLDEVSSSVDQDTDRAMQMVIREEFAAYTVIMVSHRLDMVMATCDTVVVMDRGRVVETGSPQTLVATEGSRFGELWRLGNRA